MLVFKKGARASGSCFASIPKEFGEAEGGNLLGRIRISFTLAKKAMSGNKKQPRPLVTKFVFGFLYRSELKRERQRESEGGRERENQGGGRERER